MLITQVRKGDVILDHGRKDIEVAKVELYACSSRGVHINGRYCYENTTEVTLKRSTDVAETGLGDLLEDLDFEYFPENSRFGDKALLASLESQAVKQ